MEIEYIQEGEEFLYFNIWVTSDCNYQCTYCYESAEKSHEYMNGEVANQVIKFIIKMCNEKNIKTVWMNFHGGEPLLNAKIIKYIINLLKEECGDVKLYTSTTTNCSIYDDEICEYISEITVSIDGTKSSHDRSRMLKNGTGTYEKSILNALQYLKEKKEVRLKMVVTANNVEQLYENVIHLYGLGFREIVPGIDYYDKDWNEKLFDKLYEQLKKIQVYRNEHMIDDLFLGILDETIKERGKCIVGCDGYQISVDGTLYPCILVMQQQEYCIGDIYNGMDKEKIEMINRLNHKVVEECVDCSNYKYCITSRCLLLNNQLTGDYYTPSAVICMLERVKLRLQGLI